MSRRGKDLFGEGKGRVYFGEWGGGTRRDDGRDTSEGEGKEFIKKGRKGGGLIVSIRGGRVYLAGAKNVERVKESNRERRRKYMFFF